MACLLLTPPDARYVRRQAASGYLVGDSLTYADLGSYKVLEPLEKLAAGFTLLPKWLAMMAETKGAKAVAANGVPMLPPKQ